MSAQHTNTPRDDDNLGDAFRFCEGWWTAAAAEELNQEDYARRAEKLEESADTLLARVRSGELSEDDANDCLVKWFTAKVRGDINAKIRRRYPNAIGGPDLPG